MANWDQAADLAALRIRQKPCLPVADAFLCREADASQRQAYLFFATRHHHLVVYYRDESCAALSGDCPPALLGGRGWFEETGRRDDA